MTPREACKVKRPYNTLAGVKHAAKLFARRHKKPKGFGFYVCPCCKKMHLYSK